MRLTSKAVATLTLPADKTDMIVFDSDLPGFGYRLRTTAGGGLRRSWIVQYRRAGATRRLLLGAAEVLGAEQARAAAKKALAEVALGGDPQADRHDRRGKDRQTVRTLVAEYLAAKAPKIRPRTMVEIRRYLSDPAYFGPLHNIRADAVSRKEVAARLVVIARVHGAIAGSRARAALSAFYTWSMQEGLVESNPVVGTRRPGADVPRERVLSDPELAAVWRACQKDDQFGTIVRLLILTGCRRGEIGGMRWSEINFGTGEFTIPRSRSKNARPHTLPLTPMALDILTGVPRMVGRDLLFGSRCATGFSRWPHGKAELDARSGVVEPWTVHDLRRTVATRMADLGVAPHIIEAVLNHQSGHKAGVSGVYNRSVYEREVKTALALWADRVRALVEGGERKILALPQAAG